MHLPPDLAVQSAAFLAWYVLAFVLLFRLPRDQSPSAVSSLAWWRPLLLVLPLAAGGWYLVGALRHGDVFAAYGIALLTAVACALVTWDHDAECLDLPVANVAVWVLGFGALLVRLAAPDIAPPGVAEDEAKKCLDCIGVLSGGSIFKIGSLSHPNFPCVVIGPLLAVWGPSVMVAHVYSMVTGALSVVAFYGLATLLLSPMVALASAALLAASPSHLLYSRVMFGTEITLPEILCVAFAIDAARRLSWRSGLMAGSALGILLYHYVVVRALPAVLVVIFVAAQVAERRRLLRRAATLGLIVLTAAVTISPLLWRADGRTFLSNPVQYGIFAFGGQMDLAETARRLIDIVRYHLLLFHLGAGGGHQGVIAHSRIAMLPFVLEILLIFGFADAVVRVYRFGAPVMAALFVVGLLPSILSGLANTHRSMLAIPAIYLLIGNALERLALLLPRGRLEARFAAFLLATLVAIGASQSLWFYFGPGWDDPNDAGNFGGNSAELAKEARRLTAVGVTYVTGVVAELEFLAHDQLQDGRLREFTYANWLPENWVQGYHSLLLDRYWAALRWGLRDALPSAELRVGSDPYGRTVSVGVTVSAAQLRGARPRPGDERSCGELMFALPRRVVRVRQGTLKISGVSVNALSAAQQPWFAVGLHEACLTGDVVVELAHPAGTVELIRLTAADLYHIRVRGWLHRAACGASEPVNYLAVEPFLFHPWIALPLSTFCPNGAEDTFSALLAPRTEATAFQLWSQSIGHAVISIDGEPVTAEMPREDTALFTVPATATRLDIRVQQNASVILYVQDGGTPRVADYDMFVPPVDELTVAPGAARWGRLRDSQFDHSDRMRLLARPG